MTCVLLFGASGFLGGYACRALAPHADLVCPARADCDLIRASVEELSTLVRAVQPDAVVSCVGQLAGNGYQLVRANTLVAAKLLESVAAAAPSARLIRLGSAAEYGAVPHGHAVGEDDPAVPVGEYGVSHLAATQLFELAGTAGRVDTVVLRVFNPIGNGLPEQNALGRTAALLRQARADGADHITMGSLAAYRDFVDARDVAAAIRAVVQAPALPARVFNVGSGQAVPTRQAVRLLAQAAGFTGEIRETARPSPRTVPFQSPPPRPSVAGVARSQAVSWMQADISRAGTLLGWAPTHELAASIQAMWS
jgi:nucleoside-diphosphate-sugar epimerase